MRWVLLYEEKKEFGADAKEKRMRKSATAVTLREKEGRFIGWLAEKRVLIGTQNKMELNKANLFGRTVSASFWPSSVSHSHFFMGGTCLMSHHLKAWLKLWRLSNYTPHSTFWAIYCHIYKQQDQEKARLWWACRWEKSLHDDYMWTFTLFLHIPIFSKC